MRDLLDRDISVRIRVTGASMQPFLLGGETVTIHHVQVRTLGIGDIILFVDSNNRPIMHRIVRRRCRAETIEMQTKGDSCATVDDPISNQQILGKVVRISSPRLYKSVDSNLSINLNHPGRRVQAIFIVLWSVSRSYLYRIRVLLKK